ncbi:sulfatase [Flagellimonas maritima]|nr:sulfatase [Allomuricauda aurantiaca]
MKKLFLNMGLLVMAIHLFVGCSVQENKYRRPNIVLINIDDLGWADTSFMGSEFYETPHIDDLSKQGMLFTNGYASAANCAPSRASLMTGKWVQRHGIYTVGSSERGKTQNRKLIPIANTNTIKDDFVLLPQILKENGYATCHAGKWHLSDDPLKKGFDVNIGGSHVGHPSSYYPPYGNVNLEATDKRLTDLVMDKTIDFIDSVSGPFFVNYSPYAVHTPIQPVDKLLEKYRAKQGPKGASNADYATMVQNLDQNIARLVDALKNNGAFENTFIVFTSDNGGLFAVSDQHPLRSGKGSYYEGGIRVPFFFLWKNKIKPHQKSKEPISNLDIFPTLLKVAGITKPNGLQLDGMDLCGLLVNNERSKERALFWHFPIYLQAVRKKNENRDMMFRTRPGSVIRQGKWKLHYYYEDNAVELYDLEDDPSEQLELSQLNMEKTDELKYKLSDWLEKTKAPIPKLLNPEFRANAKSEIIKNQ